MTFKELLKRNSFKEIWEALLKAHPDQESFREGYLNTYKAVISKRSKKNPGWKIRLEVVQEEGEESYIDVDGKLDEPITDEWGKWDFVGIEFSPWSEWAAAEIYPPTLELFTEEAIAAECLWEMTFSGFEEAIIQKKIKEMSRVTKEFDYEE